MPRFGWTGNTVQVVENISEAHSSSKGKPMSESWHLRWAVFWNDFFVVFRTHAWVGFSQNDLFLVVSVEGNLPFEDFWSSLSLWRNYCTIMNSSSVYFARKAAGDIILTLCDISSCWLLGPRMQKDSFSGFIKIRHASADLDFTGKCQSSVFGAFPISTLDLVIMSEIVSKICLHPALERACFLILRLYYITCI